MRIPTLISFLLSAFITTAGFAQINGFSSAGGGFYSKSDPGLFRSIGVIKQSGIGLIFSAEYGYRKESEFGSLGMGAVISSRSAWLFCMDYYPAKDADGSLGDIGGNGLVLIEIIEGGFVSWLGSLRVGFSTKGAYMEIGTGIKIRLSN